MGSQNGKPTERRHEGSLLGASRGETSNIPLCNRHGGISRELGQRAGAHGLGSKKERWRSQDGDKF